MQVPKHLLPLIEKFLSGNITSEERKMLNDWYSHIDDTTIDLSETNEQTEQQLSERIKQRLLETILNGRISGYSVVKPFYQRFKIASVAAVLLLLIGSVSLYIYNLNIQNGYAKAVISKPIIRPTDLAPGGQKAVLLLEDGKEIILDNAGNGILTNQGNSVIQKINKGQLVYLSGEQKEVKVIYNTLSTPRGGEYQLTLADGTKVWLNAASSIRFPTSFIENYRLVEITGEVYFEVAKNIHQPFIVKSGKTEIEVLGTHFNVNAYADEKEIKTSLLEGSVKVSSSMNSINRKNVYYLKPGSQAKVDKNGAIDIVQDIDTEEVMAWKNNLFIFKSTDLKSIMRQLARWYDVDIQYDGNINLRFTGQITRNNNVSKVFEKLKLTGEVNFTLMDNKIVVTKFK